MAIVAASSACMDAAPIGLISGRMEPTDRPGPAEPNWVDVRAVAADGTVAASALVEPTTAAWTLALTVGGPWQLEVGVTSARQNLLVRTIGGQPLEVRVCEAQSEELPSFAPRAPICNDGARCTAAREAAAMCVLEPLCVDADAAAQACLAQAVTACAAEDGAVRDCRERDPSADCSREVQLLEACLAAMPCEAELALRARACDLNCAALRDEVLALCDLGGDPCVPVGLYLEVASTDVDLGCSTDLPGGMP